jgi:hypothetical protein
MGPDQRLETIGELLASAPTRSGVFGREVVAAHALASNEDPRGVAERLAEAKRVGSTAAGKCLQDLSRAQPGQPLPKGADVQRRNHEIQTFRRRLQSRESDPASEEGRRQDGSA